MGEILGADKKEALMVNGDFHKRYKTFCDNIANGGNKKILAESFVFYENKIQAIPPFYELVFINEYGFFAVNFWYINFHEKVAVTDIHLYTRGYDNDEGGNGEDGFKQSEKILQQLSDVFEDELLVVAEDNIISRSLLRSGGYHIMTKDDLQMLSKMDKPMRNIPKNSYLRIGNMTPSNKKADLSYQGIRLLTEKYSQMSAMLKVYHPGRNDGKDKIKQEKLNDALIRIKQDLDILKKRMDNAN